MKVNLGIATAALLQLSVGAEPESVKEHEHKMSKETSFELSRFENLPKDITII